MITDHNTPWYKTNLPFRFTKNLELSRFLVSDNGLIIFNDINNNIDPNIIETFAINQPILNLSSKKTIIIAIMIN